LSRCGPSNRPGVLSWRRDQVPTPSVKALFKHLIKIPYQMFPMCGEAWRSGGHRFLPRTKGKAGSAVSRSSERSRWIVQYRTLARPSDLPTFFCTAPQPSSRPCKAKIRRFDSRFRNRARDRAERALDCNGSNVAAYPSPGVFRPLMRAVDASKDHHCICEGVPSGIGPAYCGLSGQTAAQTLLTLA